MTVALTCPDGLSVVLFCEGIIKALRSGGRQRVLVLTEVGEYRAQIEEFGADCINVPMSRYIDPVRDACYVMTLWRIMRREKCTGVLNFSTKPNIYGAIAARLAGVKRIVLHVVGRGASFQPGRSLKSRMMQSVMRRLYTLSCSLSDRVWFTNPNDLQFFVDTRIVESSRTILTHNYLDTSYYAPEMESEADVAALRTELAISPGQLVVLMVARLIRPKGVFEFAGAAELLRERYPDCRFLLVAPPEPNAPQSIAPADIKAYEARAHFRWLGFRHDMRRLYAMCDIAVLPTYYKEGGYPRALLEPMSMGKPLITTTSEDCRATVDEGRNGLLVPPRDTEALAEAIAMLVRDPSLRARFGRHSREKAVAEFEEKAIVEGPLREAGLVAAS
jgi:N,N'-diacetylbacillosaminyl-diphospho-undecaprenol alpha-1,3-N-acetylgalactosaminyltransferase